MFIVCIINVEEYLGEVLSERQLGDRNTYKRLDTTPTSALTLLVEKVDKFIAKIIIKYSLDESFKGSVVVNLSLGYSTY